MIARTVAFLPLLLVGLAGGPAAAGIAVTFDDLPLQAMSGVDPADVAKVNERLVGGLRERGIPVVGFVNEEKLESGGRVDPGRVAILEGWLQAGLELGNHTYSHPDLHRVPLHDYLAEIERGERVTRPLAARYGMPLRYFRHPFLHTGLDLETRNAVSAYLGKRGYTVAPVTIDNSEWIFATAYEKAHRAGNESLKRRLGDSYVEYMMAKTAYFERNSGDLFGRQIHQVLLLHANRLNADCFGALADALSGEGREFVTLETALSDPAYDSEDAWTGMAGISWLHRWALARGVPRSFFAGEPEAPAWILELSGVDAE